MAAYLWRVSPRSLRIGWVPQLTQQKPGQVAGNVATVEYFGIFDRVVITAGQGSQTSDISASAFTPAGSVTAGQGSQTSDIVGTITIVGTIDAGQGSQTVDAAGLVPLQGAVDAGQGSQTSNIVADVSPFQSVITKGWWDAANYTTQPGQSLFGLSPRSNNNLIFSLALNNVIKDEQFTLHPYNVYRDGMGTQAVTYTNQTAAPSGIAPSGLGTASVRNQHEYVSPTGIATGFAAGTAHIYNLTQYITHTGALFEAFGTTDVALGTFPQTLYAVGFPNITWGTQDVRNRNSYIAQGIMPTQIKFGATKVENSQRFLFPSGINATKYGTLTVYNSRQYKSFQGFQDDAFGTTVVFGPQWVYPHGWNSMGAATDTLVAYKIRTILPPGLDSNYQGFGRASVLKDRSIYPDGMEPPEVFGGIVGEPPLNIIDCSDASTLDSVIGTPSLHRYVGGNIVIEPAGIFSQRIGAPVVYPQSIRPSGTAYSKFGTTTVSNYIRYVFPTSVGVATRYGTQWVSFYVRNVYPVGFNKSVVWDLFGPVGLDGRAANVSAGPTIIAPDGFEGSGNTYDNCGFPRNPGVPRPSVHG